MSVFICRYTSICRYIYRHYTWKVWNPLFVLVRLYFLLMVVAVAFSWMHVHAHVHVLALLATFLSNSNFEVDFALRTETTTNLLLVWKTTTHDAKLYYYAMSLVQLLFARKSFIVSFRRPLNITKIIQNLLCLCVTRKLHYDLLLFFFFCSARFLLVNGFLGACCFLTNQLLLLLLLEENKYEKYVCLML